MNNVGYIFYVSCVDVSGELLTEAGPEEKFRIWLRERYDDAYGRLKELVCHHNPHVLELSLCTIMKLLELEGNTPITKIPAKEISFPVSKYEVNIVSKFIE